MSYPPQQPMPSQQPTPPKPPKGKGLGIAALVLGILALLFAWIPLVNIMSIILALVALVLGGIGLFVSHRPLSGSGAGLGLIALIAAIAVNATAFGEVDKAVNDSTPPPIVRSTAPVEQNTVAPTSPAPAEEPAEATTSTPEPTQASTPAEVEFKVTGEGKPDVMYGSDSDNRSGSEQSGEFGMKYAEIPWSGAVPYTDDAMYYHLTAQLGQDGGTIDCQVLINDKVVAEGHAEGEFQICNAQANSDLFGGGFS